MLSNINSINLNSSDLKYKEAIERLVKENSRLTFNNSGPSHASIVISNIFKNSSNIVRIYATNMNGEISKIGTYIYELNSFLSKHIKLKVILDKIPSRESSAFNLISSVRNEKVEVKIASHEFRRQVEYLYNDNTHFITGDDKMFRLEYDSYGHQALCGFNNEKMTNPLITLFDRHFGGCTSINI